MSETPAADKNVGSLPELTASKSRSTSSIDKTLETEKVAVTEVDSEEDVNIGVIENTEDVAIQCLFVGPRSVFPFKICGWVLITSKPATVYTFKPQNASVSQLFSLIIEYVLGTAMHSVIPSHGVWRYLNPGPFNLKEHTVITIMSGTASNVATGMEIIAALDLFYNLRLNAAVAIFFVSIGVGIGCSYAGPHGKVLMPAWSIIFFTCAVHTTFQVFSAIISVFLGLNKVLVPNGCLRLMHRSPISHRYDWVPQFNISIKYAIQIMAVFIHPGNLSVYRLCTELTSSVQGNPCNSTSFQLGQYTKLPPRITFGTQIAGSIVGAIFNYTMMKTIVSNNRTILVDPIGSRLWSGWIVQQYNSISFCEDTFARCFIRPNFRPRSPWVLSGKSFSRSENPIGSFRSPCFWAFSCRCPSELCGNFPIRNPSSQSWLPYSVNV
ncbi:hypothetical protein B0H14DRAFT_3131471, partial [Mycena olivaceomarginata]